MRCWYMRQEGAVGSVESRSTTAPPQAAQPRSIHADAHPARPSPHTSALSPRSPRRGTCQAICESRKIQISSRPTRRFRRAAALSEGAPFTRVLPLETAHASTSWPKSGHRRPLSKAPIEGPHSKAPIRRHSGTPAEVIDTPTTATLPRCSGNDSKPGTKISANRAAHAGSVGASSCSWSRSASSPRCTRS